MKPKQVLVLSAIFFVLQTTFSLWEKYLSVIGMFVFFGLIAYLLLLGVILVVQLIRLFIERFQNKARNISTVILAIAISLALLFPKGLIGPDLFRASDILIAWQEGAANCMTYVYLKSDSSFVRRNLCFGVGEITGTFTTKNDTVYFIDPSDAWGYKINLHHAVLTRDSVTDTIRGMWLYTTPEDTFGYPLQVKLDEMSK